MVDDGWVLLRPGIMRKPLATDDEKGVQVDLIRIDADFTDSSSSVRHRLTWAQGTLKIV